MDTKKILKTGAIALAGLVIGGMGGAMAFPKVITETVEVEVPIEAPVPQITEVEVLVEVPVIEYVNQTEIVEVEVDNGNLDMVLDHIYNNDGQIEYLLDDLDDDEIDFIVDRIIFMNDAKTMGVDYIEAELADELDNYVFTNADNSTVEFDDDDITDIDVDDDFDDIVVEDVDFDDDETDLIYEVKFEHDDVDYIASVRVEIRDGEADDMDILSVELDE